MAILEVGSARAEPGAKGQGAIQVVQRYDGSWVSIPVMLVNGAKDGPTLLVQGGIHGSEYPGIEAVWRVVRWLDPARLSGRVIAVPVTNPPAFSVDNRVNALDHQDMNRIFPGKPDGTLSERMAHALATEVISKANVMIDLHASSDGVIIPVAIARRGLEDMTLDLAKATGLENIWMGGKLGVGVLCQATALALQRGVRAVTIEAGGSRDYRPEDADLLCGTVLNVMKYLGMIEGQPSQPKRRVTFTADLWPQAGASGFFRPFVVPGQRVKKGEPIGIIYDVYEQELERMEAPYDGLVLLLIKKRSVQTGDYIYIYGDIIEEEIVE